jgi:uncharacterized heparinase superfamily protein
MVFRESGYAVLGDGPSHLVFDAGSLGYLSIAAHGHADALSICLAVDGEWWIVDPGTYVYHADLHWRDYFRGTAAHSTISVDGYNQSRIGGPFLWTDHARAGITDGGTGRDGRQRVEGHHDGYRFLGIVHRRRVAFIPAENRFDIVDALEGGGMHRVAVRFHLAPGLDVSRPDPEGEWIVRRENHGRFLKIAVDRRWHWEVVKGSDDPKLGWFSPRFGTRVPSPVLQGTGETDLPTLLETRVTIGFA